MSVLLKRCSDLRLDLCLLCAAGLQVFLLAAFLLIHTSWFTVQHVYNFFQAITLGVFITFFLFLVITALILMHLHGCRSDDTTGGIVWLEVDWIRLDPLCFRRKPHTDTFQNPHQG